MVAFRSAFDASIRVPAKVNLFFEVLGRRSDGFHEIETLMVPIDLFDELFFESDSSGQVAVECAWASANIRAAHATLGKLPDSASNLATRAVELLKQRAGVNHGARIRLLKRIPLAAGLGGGSADAAAALIAANLAWNLGWSRERLAQVAAELGSDVPFFLYGGSAICRGRGEKIEPVTDLGIWHAVVVKPPEGLSTADVYRNCRPTNEPRPIEPLVAAMRRGDCRGIAIYLANRLEPAAAELSPSIGELSREFRRLDCVAAQMSGSGSSDFGICRSARHARRMASLLRARNVGRVFVVRMGA